MTVLNHVYEIGKDAEGDPLAGIPTKYRPQVLQYFVVNEGLKVDKDTEIVIYVSAGTSSLIVPDVVGYSLNAANKSIMNAKLMVEIVQEYSDTVEEGFVISQSPEGDERVPADSTVTIRVSLGKVQELVEVPDVKGKPFEEASKELTDKGFVLGTTESVYNNVYAEGYVCYQNVAAGTDVAKGTIIDLQISKGSEPVLPDTYSYNASINAPSSTEDPDYKSGEMVRIVIYDDNGKVWYDSTAEAFPVSVNLWNMQSTPNGHITLTYTVTLKGEPYVDPETGETIVPEGEKEERTIKRDISFIKDE